MIRKSLALVQLTLLALAMASCAGGKSDKPEYVLRFGHLANRQHGWHQAAERFAEEVSRLSDGRMQVKVYPSEQLGKEMDVLTGILVGSADIMITGESLQSWSLPYAILCATPYAIRDSEHLKKVAGGPIGKEIEQHIIEGAGFKPIAWFERGARNLTANRIIRHPDDLNGMILRVPAVSLYVKTWSALGAKPTPMAFSEVFTALQQSTIHGQENPFALIKDAGLYEVQKYCMLTEHVKGWSYVVMSNKKYESLPKDLQQVIDQAAHTMQQYEHELFLRQEKIDYEHLLARGMEFIEVDKGAFRAAASSAVTASFDEGQNDLLRRIQEIQ
ncbi:TRAP-type C4-dicarboxylate transport system, periplasmic component [Lunatimonas lonarensis]|uniref:TRAP-type C4-dicarboxylate transport system, periplasmic component n=1 Tax=Lunatimonas lonarensis TaxID=1232681 RepID=R7ZME2_9BACT|nr:TRAP transporter substrate-binding protein [Lunatimonas lonarensis]EON75265.1 TRAP-type C4-dicarboxylate transport system, periplasmic component [Lunatimonas lonarensis]